MLRFLVAAGLLLPQLAWAQLFSGGGFAEGSYVLEDSQTVRHTGQLKLQDGTTLVVKDASGKKLKLRPAQVASFRIGRQRYVPAGDFHAMGGLGGIDVGEIFAEQLDSGKVQLLRYTYSVNTPMSMGAGGAMTGGGSWDLSTFLLRTANDFDYTAVQNGAYSNAGKRFREALRPFLAARPDLLKLLDDKRINMNNLPAVIHALNNNQPYTPPAGASATD